MQKRVCVFHWNGDEAAARAGAVESAGYDVSVHTRFDPVVLRALAESPPDAFVIDLSRLPSQGRDAALALRSRAGTRQVPLVVVGGSDETTERLRTLVPDAVRSDWKRIGPSLKRAIAKGSATPGKRE